MKKTTNDFLIDFKLHAPLTRDKSKTVPFNSLKDRLTYFIGQLLG